MSHWYLIIGLTLFLGESVSSDHAVAGEKEDRFRTDLARRMHIYHKVYLNRHLLRDTQHTAADRSVDQTIIAEKMFTVDDLQKITFSDRKADNYEAFDSQNSAAIKVGITDENVRFKKADNVYSADSKSKSSNERKAPNQPKRDYDDYEVPEEAYAAYGIREQTLTDNTLLKYPEMKHDPYTVIDPFVVGRSVQGQSAPSAVRKEYLDLDNNESNQPVFDPLSKRNYNDYMVPKQVLAAYGIRDDEVDQLELKRTAVGRGTLREMIETAKLEKTRSDQKSNANLFEPLSVQQTTGYDHYPTPDNQDDAVIKIVIADPFDHLSRRNVNAYVVPEEVLAAYGIRDDEIDHLDLKSAVRRVAQKEIIETAKSEKTRSGPKNNANLFDPLSVQQTTGYDNYPTPDNQDDAVIKIVISDGKRDNVKQTPSPPVFDHLSSIDNHDYVVPEEVLAAYGIRDDDINHLELKENPVGRAAPNEMFESAKSENTRSDPINNAHLFDPFSVQQTNGYDSYPTPDNQDEAVIKIVIKTENTNNDNNQKATKDAIIGRSVQDLNETKVQLGDGIEYEAPGETFTAFGIKVGIHRDESLQDVFHSKADIVTELKQSPDKIIDYVTVGRNVRDETSISGATKNSTTNILENIINYYLDWQSIPKDLTNKLLHHIGNDEEKLSLTEAITKVGSTDSYLNLFWPFKYDIVEMNQIIALYGISGELSGNNLKSRFYSSLYDMYSLSVPFDDDELLLSFNEHHVAETLSRSKLLNGSETYIVNKEYAYSEIEKSLITNKINAAMELINETAPELYRSINQLIACIAVYKSERAERIGGSSSALPGVIYLTPIPDKNDWSVPFYAEQIVHEFTHNALYLEEFVIGTYDSHVMLSQGKVFSSIRGVPRNYDLSLHAAYVSTGLVVFHSRAGYHARAEHYAGPLAQAVQALVDVNKDVRVLSTAGEAMLQTLVDYVDLMKIGRIEM